MKEVSQRRKTASQEPTTETQGGAGKMPPAFSLSSNSPKQMKANASQPIQREMGAKFKPTGQSDPKAVIPIAKLIQLVAEVEAAYPQDSREEIVTRIRQMYYSGVLFNFLIPKAHFDEVNPYASPNVTGEFLGDATRPRMLDSHKLKPDTYAHLTAQADENARGDNPSPYILADGKKIDLGHMLLGLDALLHPDTAIPYTTYGIPNIDPSTWVADLAIGSVWMTHHERNGTPHPSAPNKLSQPNLDAYYRMSAPTEDLLGDVDAFGMGDTAKKNATLPLSRLLQVYYLGKGQGAAAKQSAGVSKRWQTFCDMSGLHYKLSGGSVQWVPSSVAHFHQRVNHFSDLYGDGQEKAAASVVTKANHRQWPHTKTVLDKFLAFVKQNLEAELRQKR